MVNRFLAAMLASAAVLLPVAAGAQTSTSTSPAQALASLAVDIPATKFVLRNGLTLIVHEDTKAPVVHVNIWYHVGSKNEPRGQSGFAHLFEHLMFQGSENFNDDFFKATRQIGATSQNGTTSTDRTNYFQTVPKEALDYDPVARVRSDGPLPRRADAGPARRAARRRPEREAPGAEPALRHRAGPDHPRDLPRGASLRAQRHRLDGRSAGRLARAGARVVPHLLRAVERRPDAVRRHHARGRAAPGSNATSAAFNPGTPVAHPKSWIAKRTGAQREIAYDRVSAPRLIEDLEHSRVRQPRRGAARCLRRRARRRSHRAADEAARLRRADRDRRQRLRRRERDRRPVHGDRDRQARRRHGPHRAHRGRGDGAADGRPGPTASELEKVRARERRRHGARPGIDQQQGARSWPPPRPIWDRPTAGSARFEFQRGPRPPAGDCRGGARVARPTARTASPSCRSTTRRRARTSTGRPCRCRRPARSPPASFPAIQRATLSNGLKVMLVERHQAPLVSRAISCSTRPTRRTSPQTKAGTGGLAVEPDGRGHDDARLARHWPTSLSASAPSWAQPAAASSPRFRSRRSSPRSMPALAIFADVIRNPAYRQADVDRVKAQQAAAIRAQRLQPASIANRVLSRIIYGPSHPLGRQTTEASVASITRDDLVALPRALVQARQRPSLLVVGDTTLAELTPKLEAALGSWQASRRRDAAHRGACRRRRARRRSSISSTAPARRSPTCSPGCPRAPRDTGRRGIQHLGVQHQLRRQLHEPDQHEPARGQGLVLRRQLGARRRARSADVPHHRADPDRQDQGVDPGTAEGVARRPRHPPAHAGRADDDAEQHDHGAVGPVGIVGGGASARWRRSSPTVCPTPTSTATCSASGRSRRTWRSRPGHKLVPAQNFAWVVVGDRRRIEAGLRELGIDVRIVNADGEPAN